MHYARILPISPIKDALRAEIAGDTARFLGNGGTVSVVDGFAEIIPKPVNIGKPIPDEDRYSRQVSKNNTKINLKPRSTAAHIQAGMLTADESFNYLNESHGLNVHRDTFKWWLREGKGPAHSAEKTNGRGYIYRFFEKSKLDLWAEQRA